jgi:hypothetical protein
VPALQASAEFVKNIFNKKKNPITRQVGKGTKGTFSRNSPDIVLLALIILHLYQMYTAHRFVFVLNHKVAGRKKIQHSIFYISGSNLSQRMEGRP